MNEAIAPPETRTRPAEQLADRYLALWNEPDAHRRQRMIAELWTENGSQILQPPQEMREIAASPGIGLVATLEARGHAELEARAATSYEHWVGSEGLSFRGRDDAERLGDVVKFHWEGVAKDGEAFAVGLDGPRPRCGRPDRARLHVHVGVRRPLHSRVSREARANASVPPGHDALPRRLTTYPTVHSVRTSAGILAKAEA